ncbi:HAMP domain-containing histidine kinase [Oscillibacter sp. MSJ-2]|uniref:histidine kinase n=1 Tax=Dysosmobacter acutus TaxID=2841504 RepID=A0ABS6FCS0_9FIRM|nr:HAMP domain-containing histidine kinase [Dysosmobacter acutus]
MLILLNTYPLIVSENLVFQSKQSTLQNNVTVMVSALSGLDRLTEENVTAAMTVVEETGISRILVTDAKGKVLYDTRETGGAVGSYALYTEIVQALDGNDTFYCSFSDDAFRSRASSPVLYQNQIIGSVYAYEYDTAQASLLRGFQSNLRSLSMVVGLLVLALSAILSRALTRQISDLLSAIRKVREGAYSHRAEIHGHDEIAQIATEFNSLTDRLQTTETARRRFVSDASHELKTPLAAIRLLSDSILQTENIDPDTTREFVADIEREAERLSRITEDLLQLTRLDGDLLAPAVEVELLPVVRQVVRMMELVATEKNISLTYQAPDFPCFVLSTRDEIHQVIYNLLDNAVKYSGEGGWVQLRLGKEAEQVVLAVEDNGIGIPEEDLPRIFERFYRVDKARSRAAGGTGLGLAIVSDTVRRRGGSITAANRSGGGTVFTVRWPAAGEGGQSE